eukprot:3398045-Amphidinium_carterae.1
MDLRYASMAEVQSLIRRINPRYLNQKLSAPSRMAHGPSRAPAPLAHNYTQEGAKLNEWTSTTKVQGSPRASLA